MEEKKRYLFIDIIKFIALLLIPVTNVYNLFAMSNLLGENISEYTGVVMGVLSLIAPTIFMLSMGASLNLESNKDCKSNLVKGLKILLGGIIINIIRVILVYFISLQTNEEFKDLLITLAAKLVGNDILMFAGLYYIIFGLTRLFGKIKDVLVIVFSILFYFVSVVVPIEFRFGNEIIDTLFSNIIYMYDTYFPLLSWFIVPSIGYFFLKAFLNSKRKNLFMLISLLISISIFGLSLLFTILTSNEEIIVGLSFLTSVPTMLITISSNFIYLIILYYISFIFDRTIITRNLMIFESRNVKKIYYVQCVIVPVFGFIFAALSIVINYDVIVYLIGLIVIVVSSLVVLLFNLIIKRSKIFNKK